MAKPKLSRGLAESAEVLLVRHLEAQGVPLAPPRQESGTRAISLPVTGGPFDPSAGRGKLGQVPIPGPDCAAASPTADSAARTLTGDGAALAINAASAADFNQAFAAAEGPFGTRRTFRDDHLHGATR